jgi:hypothetical protein
MNNIERPIGSMIRFLFVFEASKKHPDLLEISIHDPSHIGLCRVTPIFVFGRISTVWPRVEHDGMKR